MGFYLIQIALVIAIVGVAGGYLWKKLGKPFSDFQLKDHLSGQVTCPNCEGRGYWLNTRNREMCDWCQGSGKVPKDFPLL